MMSQNAFYGGPALPLPSEITPICNISLHNLSLQQNTLKGTCTTMVVAVMTPNACTTTLQNNHEKCPAVDIGCMV